MVIKLLNKLTSEITGGKAKFNEDEISVFLNNQNVMWIFSKVLDEMGLSRKEILKFGFSSMGALLNNNFNNIETNLKGSIERFKKIKNLSISPEEAKLFKNNRTFYKLLGTIILRLNHSFPYSVKRKFIELNNGDVLMNDIIEEIKNETT